MARDITINPLDPNTFEYQTYSDNDTELIVQSQLDTAFNPDTDYIEYYAYDQNQNLIYPGSTIPLLNYDIREGDVLLNPEKDLTDTGFDIGTYNILYNFYRKRLASDISLKYFITDISSDRTEIRLDSNIIPNDLIISSSNSFIQYREESTYFVDFYLNFGLNQTVIANNIKLETEEGIDPTILVKLYEPLPTNFNVKDELWIVEELSLPQAYEVDFPFEPIVEDDFTYISGPNYNLNITQETSTGGESFSFNTLLQSDVTSSVNQIKNLLNQKEINININYENYANFVNFSSAKTRLENFYYKVGLIQSASNQLSSFLDDITGTTTNTVAYSSSRAQLTGRIDNIIKNFDGYESFLYFNSGSKYSYPKTNTSPPYILAPTSSVQALEWIGSATVGDTYYGGQALSASNYDQDNRDWLYWSIPEYLRDDPDNERYELFVDMVGQYYDNVWVYTKDISNKFDADNRLEYGIAKDLVADAIRDFGVKLYASNFNTNDLFTAFLGLTPSGSTFPFPNMTGSVVDSSGNLDIPSGFEYVNTEISASNDIVPLNNVQKQLYKRIYHNIPYLLKTKGTVAGIRALITSYGIPDTILRISEFGGKDRNESQDWDLKQNVFNYAFDTGENAIGYVTSSFNPSNDFNPSSGAASPGTVQFRFKSAPIPTGSNNQPSPDIRDNQLLWLGDRSLDASFNTLGTAVVLEYTGSGFTSGSYSGSIASPYDTWGTLKFYPDLSYNSDVTCSVFAPFFNGDWWSVQLTYTGSGVGGASSTVSASLFAANEIDGKVGFSGSELKLALDSRSWNRSNFAALNYPSNRTINSTVYQPFSGAFQEYRMFVPNVVISESKFFDYTLNPYSNEGNTINSTPDELMFRTSLGTQLDTGSRTSIHPRVTGSAVQITQSFAGDTSEFYINSPKFITNVEDIFQDQVPAGIKNRVTNKIQTENLILAEAPYGFQTPTSSKATISSPTSDVISPIESIQQHSFVSQSYTPNVNYLEVAFSPSNQINDDINAQIGYFNLGDYIGDPRQNFSSSRSYPDLDVLRDAYFEKYIRGYDVADFVRLIKFFDNSLFKMIKDFTPARTSLASGVVVKQHLLERNRQRPALATSSLHDYEGLVVNLPKDYSSGSSDFPQYSTEGSAIYKFTGGTGGSFERFNGLQTYPSGTLGFGPDNRFHLTQSWADSLDYSVINSLNFNQSNSFFISASGGAGKFPGTGRWIKDNQSEFYDGIFSGSSIQVTTQDLNPGCEPYLNVPDKPIVYKPLFFSFDVTSQGTVIRDGFINNQNNPNQGDAWIISDNVGGGVYKVQFIKLARFDINGAEVGEYLQGAEKLEIIFQEGTKEYYIDGVTTEQRSTLINVNQTNGDPTFIFSEDGGSENFSLRASGSFTASYTGNDNTSQGSYLASDREVMDQRFWFWGDQNGNPYTTTDNDSQGFFRAGTSSVSYADILTNPDNFSAGSYSLVRTPNIPLYFSASIAYSASDLGVSGEVTTQGLLYSASYNENNAATQDFTFSEGGTNPENYSGVYRPSSDLTFSELGLSPTFFQGFDQTNIGSDIATPRTIATSGMPTLKNPMTSSLKWNIPYLNASIWSTTTAAPTFSWVGFSGSAVSSNSNWNYAASTFIKSYDGTQAVSGQDITIAAGSAAGGINVNLIYNAEVNAFWTMSAATGTEITGALAVFRQRKYSSPQFYPNLSSNNPTAGIILTGSAGVDWYISSDYTDSGFCTESPTHPGEWHCNAYTFIYPYWSDDPTEYFIEYFKPIAKSTTIDPSTGVSVSIYNFEVVANVDFQGADLADYSEYGLYIDSAQPGGYGNFSGTWFPINNSFTTQRFAKFDLQAHLMVTGSEESNPARRITSSGVVEIVCSESFGDGSQDPQILRIPFGTTDPTGTGMLGFFDNIENNVEYDAGDSATTSSTRTNIDDMYFVEYSMSNYSSPQALEPGGGQTGIRFYDPGYTPIPTNTASFLQITGSVVGVASGAQLTGSLYIQQTNPNGGGSPKILTATAENGEFRIDSNTATGTAELTGSILGINTTADWLTNFRMGVEVSKSFGTGVTITNYTMSIFPSSSRWSPMTDTLKMSDGTISPVAFNRYRVPEDTSELLTTFFGGGVLPFYLATDCQPLLNNYSNQRANPFLMDIDYNFQATNTASFYYSNSAAPVNLRQIISGSAVRAAIPVSNYTIARSINPRYNGSKSTSQQLNVWNIGDTGTFGKLPTLELKDAFFGYFNDLDDPYPNINGLTRVNLNYLIDEQGNALPPSLEPLAVDTFKAVFPNTTNGRIAAKSGKTQYRDLGAPAPIERTMTYVTPIIYSQNSSNNYAPVIPLSGSGYISAYDNGDAQDALFARFTALGSASIDTSFPQQSVDFYLDPSEAVTGSGQNDYPGTTNPWDATGFDAQFKAANYSNEITTSPPIVKDEDLPTEQIVSLQTSFVTSFVSETRGVRDELAFELHMYSSGSGVGSAWTGTSEKPFNLEDIQCKVYTEDGRVTNIGSVMDYGWFEISNIVNYSTVKRKTSFKDYFRKWRYKRWKYTRVPVPTGGIRCTVDWEMYNTLFDLGLYRSSLYEIAALEWIITANSGKYIIKGGDAINWRINGSFKNAKSGYRQGVFFPINYEGAYTAVNIQGQGANDYLMDEANTAKRPYWVYTGSAGGGSNVLDQSILVMSSSNMNEAYGTTFRQGDLEYFPGRSDYFPGGVEPANTSFDPIENTIELREGDEIRFANNENYTYKITEVFAPSENIEGTGTSTNPKKGRLKIKLSGPVPKGVNLDFFLVRRAIPNPNSLYLDTQFPYESLSSASISFVTKNTGSLPTFSGSGYSGNFAITSSAMLPGLDADGNYKASLSTLEIATTPGIMYPDFPTDYLIQSASIIVNDLISRGIIES